MASLGMVPPDVVNLVPKINLDEPVREMGIQLGQLLRKSGLYRYGVNERLVTFSEGKRKDMTPVKFCGWVEKHVAVVKSYKGKGGAIYDHAVSMGKDLASKLLEVEEFLRELPVIDAVLPTRVPVLRADGRKELCAVGYDEEARTYCLDEVPFEVDWTVQQGMEHIEKRCGEFPFAERSGWLWENRSFLVHLSGLLGVFNRRLLAPGTVRPAIIIVANEQGSGKSLLVSMMLAACFGQAASSDLPMSAKGLNQEKFTALLEAIAQSMKEYLWLDDVPPTVFSNSLNRFITASAHSARKYGTNDEVFDVPAVTQVFMTGNNVELTRDLLQRALVVELFLEVDSQSKKHEQWLTPLSLCTRSERSAMLSALWAITRRWLECGEPASTSVQTRAPDWSRMVGGIIGTLGVSRDPFEIPALPMSGDRETEEWRELLRLLADEAEAGGADLVTGRYEVDTEAIVNTARDAKLLADLVGGADDKPLKGGELKRLGKRLAKWRGREDLKSSSGRGFRFGKRKQSSNWVYPIEWLDQEGAGTQGSAKQG